MSIDEAQKRIKKILDQKTPLLIKKLSKFLNDLPFEVLDHAISKNDIDAIYFEYESDSLTPIACPLNSKVGYCGAGEVVEILNPDEDQLFPYEYFFDLIKSCSNDQKEAFEESLFSLQANMYEQWFIDCWKQTRNLRPSIRGFISIHDSSYCIDLDSKAQLKIQDGTKFF
ncbi:MAG: hypothetical protein V4525_03770 [Pseudomonadota bacterium]